MTKERLKLLAIEDNVLCAELLTKKLKGRYDLVFAHSKKDGIDKLDAGRWDCVLLDLGLHDAIREQVMDEIMEHSGDTAILILTGHSDPRLRDHMLLRHADGFAVKGMEDSPEDLDWLIQQAIAHRKKRG